MYVFEFYYLSMDGGKMLMLKGSDGEVFAAALIGALRKQEEQHTKEAQGFPARAVNVPGSRVGRHKQVRLNLVGSGYRLYKMGGNTAVLENTKDGGFELFSHTDGEGNETVMLEGNDPVVFAHALIAAIRKGDKKYRKQIALWYKLGILSEGAYNGLVAIIGKDEENEKLWPLKENAGRSGL